MSSTFTDIVNEIILAFWHFTYEEMPLYFILRFIICRKTVKLRRAHTATQLINLLLPLILFPLPLAKLELH